MVLELTDDAIRSCRDVIRRRPPERALVRPGGVAKGRECLHSLVHLIDIVRPVVGVVLLRVQNTVEYHSPDAVREHRCESAADDSAVADAVAPQSSLFPWLSGQISFGFDECEQVMGDGWRSHVV